MATKKKATEAVAPVARSVAIAEKGVATSAQYANLMASLMVDLVNGSMTPQVAHAVCKAGSNLLRVVEMEQKYGKGEEQKTLRLSDVR